MYDSAILHMWDSWDNLEHSRCNFSLAHTIFDQVIEQYATLDLLHHNKEVFLIFKTLNDLYDIWMTDWLHDKYLVAYKLSLATFQLDFTDNFNGVNLIMLDVIALINLRILAESNLLN